MAAANARHLSPPAGPDGPIYGEGTAPTRPQAQQCQFDLGIADPSFLVIFFLPKMDIPRAIYLLMAREQP